MSINHLELAVQKQCKESFDTAGPQNLMHYSRSVIESNKRLSIAMGSIIIL